jgi:uncharacterized protein
MKLYISALLFATSLLAGNYEDGLSAFQAQDYKKANHFFTLGANQGNVGSQIILAEMYFKGIGVKQDYKEAARLYTLAAEQGVTLAQNFLGVMYYEGKGVEQNKFESYKYFLRAAKGGNTEAANNLDVLCSQNPWVCK